MKKILLLFFCFSLTFVAVAQKMQEWYVGDELEYFPFGTSALTSRGGDAHANVCGIYQMPFGNHIASDLYILEISYPQLAYDDDGDSIYPVVYRYVVQRGSTFKMQLRESYAVHHEVEFIVKDISPNKITLEEKE